MKLLILAAMFATSAIASEDARPSAHQVVQAQAEYAAVQLKMLGAFYSEAPAPAAREAFRSGNAPILWRYYSPALGSIARGPSLTESLASLLANVAAGKAGCDALEGPCQDKARRSGLSQASAIVGSAHPGQALAKLIGD